MSGEPNDEGGNMPIEEDSESGRPKGPMSPPDDATADGGGSMPIEDDSDDDRPKGPMSPS